MPMPYTYRHASAEFRLFLDIARAEMNLDSDNATYTAVQGVFQVFRRRLTLDQTLRFADLMPAIPRAIFVQGWHPAPPAPWGSRAEQVAEAQALRPHHNLTPDTCITATAIALGSQIHENDLQSFLAGLGPEALQFWHVTADRRRSVQFP